MRKLGLIFSIFMIFVLMFGLVACTLPGTEGEGGEEDPIYFADDQQYSIDYKVGVADCNMSLDGQGHCTIKKKYSYEAPLDTTKLYNVTYTSSRNVWFAYKDDTTKLDFTNSYAFGTSGNLEYYNGNLDWETIYYKFQAAIGKQFSMSYETTVEGMKANITITMQPVSQAQGEFKVAFGYSISVPEYVQASGGYTIINGKFIKLKFNYTEEDIPTTGLEYYQILPLKSGYNSTMITEAEGRKNGLLAIQDSSITRYIQIRDDGTFDFVRASTTVSEQDLFTQDTYFNKTFTTTMCVFSEGEAYQYEYEISFDSQGKATYAFKSASMMKNYRASEEGVSLLYYDIDAYNALIGTHRGIGTSNNISFTNDYKIYVDYNYSRYTFEGDTNIILVKFEKFYYLKLTSPEGTKIVAKIYGNDDIEWGLEEFEKVDLKDHSEDL